ncbi:FtsK/SpoIIIE domain-containing protein [Paenibacillus sp. FSL E2-0230]|uniref:FtsK/SpoIIIE domain-containing protein n=1 Tax=Paenibacillus sp. FSL E2-0230 TaxID=2954727 RepID=UPI0030D3D6FF
MAYGEEVAFPSINAQYAYPWGVRLLIGLPVGLTSQKFMDHKLALAEAIRVDPNDVEMRYKDGIILDIFTAEMPESVPYKRPEGDSYRVLIGVTRRGEERYYDFDGAYPHLLIGGISGGGKSVMLRSILTTLVTGPAPDMYLCDLKGGVELGIFRNLECVKGFATTLQDVQTVLASIEREMLRRYEVMSANGSQRWEDKKAIFVVDELADFKTRAGDPDSKLKGEIKSILTRLSAKGRAAGVLILLATQRPSADIVDGLIKTNIAASICFRTRDGTQSRIILDNTSAESLPDIPGRLIFQTAYDETLQAPYLTAEEARKLIADLPTKEIKEAIHYVADSQPNAGKSLTLDRNFIEL